MSEGKKGSFSEQSAQLNQNLVRALRVAGNEQIDGKAGKLRPTDIYRKTGMARSTLRAIQQPAPDHNPNPDLKTLCRLADVLGIPVAFLLMRPKDWILLSKAFRSSMPEMTYAAKKLLSNNDKIESNIAERILRLCGVHPEKPPQSLDQESDKNKKEFKEMERINEKCRRMSHVLSELMLQDVKDDDLSIHLSAYAAAITNQAKTK